MYYIRSSALIEGVMYIGKGSKVSYGTYIFSQEGSVTLSNNSMILENSYVYGTKAHPVKIGQKTVFGHRCKIIGAQVGNYCEIGNGVFIDQGARIGDYCIMGEGTYVPKNTVIPSNSVILGNPFRFLRKISLQDKEMIAQMRGNDMELVEEELYEVRDFYQKQWVKPLVAYKGILPKVGNSILEDEVELIGKVVLGDHCHLKKGVKVIGDSHGTVTIGNHVTIGENTVVHLLPSNHVLIKDHVQIGKESVVHGCILEEGVMIEDYSIICDNSHIGKGTLVKEGSLVPQRKVLGEGLIVSGNPVK